MERCISVGLKGDKRFTDMYPPERIEELRERACHPPQPKP